MPKYKMTEYGRTEDTYIVEADNEEAAMELIENNPFDYVVASDGSNDFWEVEEID